MDDKKDGLIKIMSDAAADFKGKYSFVYLDDDKYPGMKEQFGLTGTPGIAIANMTTNKNFVFSEEFNVANMKAFLTK